MSLASWFVSTCYVASVASTDTYGTSAYGVKRAVKCRVEAARRLTRRSNGDEAVSTHTLYTDQPVLLSDRIWLPGVPTATDDGARSPISITASSDKSGARTLYKVELG